MASVSEPIPGSAPDAGEVLWTKPEPLQDTRPTYAPGGVAIGVAMGLWGMLTHWVMTAGGLVLFLVSLWWWVVAIRTNWRSEDD